MNLFKLATLCIFTLQMAAATAQPGVVCSQGLSADSPLFNTALHNIYSLSYVREAMDQWLKEYPDAQFCVSGAAVSRNMYQYPKYYVQISVEAENQVRHEMRFLFQDASVQALDNVGGKPWIGLPSAQTDSVLTAYVAGLPLTPVETSAFDVLAIAQTTATYHTSADQIDEATVSILPVTLDSDPHEYYIVSWLTRPENNPYASFVTLKGVLVAHDPSTGEVSISENLWLTQNLFQPFDDLLDKNFVPDDERAQSL